MSSCSLITAENVKTFLDSFDAVLFDCDGVLWNGNQAIPGSPETVKKLTQMGKRVFYLTNNSTKTRTEFLQKCHKLGFDSQVNEIFSTGFASACYLKSLGFKKKVYVVGSKGVTQELEEVGIQHEGEGPDPISGDVFAWTKQVKLDPEVGAVVVGFDAHISYAKILKAASYLSKPDCLFVATNTDERFPTEDENIIIPGAGCNVAPISLASGREPIVLGKPSPYIFDIMVKEHGLDASRTLMVGDRLNTDIMLGKNCNMKATLLVLSGVTYQSDVDRIKTAPQVDDVIPDFYLPSLQDLGDLIPL